MFKKVLIAVFFVCIGNIVCEAQHITTGNIQFERKINLQKQSSELSYLERLKKDNLQFKTDIFDFNFNEQGSVYLITQADEKIDFFNVPALNNIVIHDFKSKTKLVKKEIFDQAFIVKDTGCKIQWKYTGELREIAGYECKKAEAIIFDSIYVVAFYAEEILAPGGPESFHGLPGMILGLAIPRLNTTWFATKVELIKGDLNKFKHSIKGTVTDSQNLKILLEKNSSSWGTNANRYLIWSVI